MIQLFLLYTCTIVFDVWVAALERFNFLFTWPKLYLCTTLERRDRKSHVFTYLSCQWLCTIKRLLNSIIGTDRFKCVSSLAFVLYVVYNNKMRDITSRNHTRLAWRRVTMLPFLVMTKHDEIYILYTVLLFFTREIQMTFSIITIGNCIVFCETRDKEKSHWACVLFSRLIYQR